MVFSLRFKLTGGGILKIPYKEKFSAGWSALEKKLMPAYVWASDPLTFWRERVLFIICFFSTIFGPIALIPSLLLAYSEGLWSIVLIDSLTYVTVVVILIARNVSLVIRALVLCFIIYTLGISILFVMGPLGAGYIWLFGASVLISAFIGIGASIFTLAVNTIALLSVGIFIAYGNPAWALHVDNALKKWLVMSANFLVLNFFITITTAFLQNGLKKALLLEQKTSKSLRESEERFKRIFDEGPFGMSLVSPDHTIIVVNKVLCDLLGYAEQELAGRSIEYITYEEDRKKGKELLGQLFVKSIPSFRREKRYVKKDGSILWTNITTSSIYEKEGNVLYALTIIEDRTESKQAEEKIHMLAYYDILTGLPNRTFYKELMKRAIEHASRRKEIFALIYVGLDNFQRINDTFGYGIGDILLKDVAKRLTSCLRRSDCITISEQSETENVLSRVGGDEFIVMTHDLNNAQDAAKASNRLIEEMNIPFDLSGGEVFVSCSIGISLYPDDGTDVDDLIKNAEKAMRHTKNKGKNNYHFYSNSMNSSVLEHLALENDLRKALKRNELVLYYQPKVDTQTGIIKGMEALLRWIHPDKGLITPIHFIPAAEKSGLIIPIGEFVIRAACRQIKTWQESGYKQIKIAVNVSGHQFDQQNLIGIVKEALQETLISPHCLDLEITESIIMQNPEKAIQDLTELKRMGIGIAIDDFGTGYSSFSYLKRLPLDFLKIDQSFIQSLASDPNDQVIVRATIIMAHSLNLKTIAEGVETSEQLAILRVYGCDEIQGYLFSKPLPAKEIPEILEKGYL